MTISMYARRKQWPLEREVVLDGALSAEQRAQLLSIASRCPVHRTLTSAIVIDTRLAAPGGAGA